MKSKVVSTVKLLNILRHLSELEHLEYSCRSALGRLQEAREGGIFSRVLALASIAQNLGTSIVRTELIRRGGFPSCLETDGYERLDKSVYSTLLPNAPGILRDTVVVHPLEHLTEVIWRDGLARWTCQERGDSDFELKDGPFVPVGGTDFIEAIKRDLWRDSKAMLLCPSDNTPSFDGAPGNKSKNLVAPGVNFLRLPDTNPKDYLGKLPVDLQEKITTLVAGPSRCGKTFGILVGASENSSRVLKVTSLGVRRVGIIHFLSIVKVLGPDVLLIEDIQDFASSADADFLQLLETLNGRYPVILTWMHDDIGKPGSLRAPGLGPGRIDQLVIVSKPDASTRRRLIEIENPKATAEVISQISTLTEGLSHAHVRDIARKTRTSQCGINKIDVENEVKTWRLMTG